MKLNRDWLRRKIQEEGDYDVGAGYYVDRAARRRRIRKYFTLVVVWVAAFAAFLLVCRSGGTP